METLYQKLEAAVSETLAGVRRKIKSWLTITAHSLQQVLGLRSGDALSLREDLAQNCDRVCEQYLALLDLRRCWRLQGTD